MCQLFTFKSKLLSHDSVRSLFKCYIYYPEENNYYFSHGYSDMVPEMIVLIVFFLEPARL